MTDNRPQLDITLQGTKHTGLTIEIGKYGNGEPAVQLFDPDGEFGGPELVAVATVNLEGYGITADPGCIWVKDYSENSGMVVSLISAGLIQLTGRACEMQWVTVPEAKPIGYLAELIEASK